MIDITYTYKSTLDSDFFGSKFSDSETYRNLREKFSNSVRLSGMPLKEKYRVTDEMICADIERIKLELWKKIIWDNIDVEEGDDIFRELSPLIKKYLDEIKGTLWIHDIYLRIAGYAALRRDTFFGYYYKIIERIFTKGDDNISEIYSAKDKNYFSEIEKILGQSDF